MKDNSSMVTFMRIELENKLFPQGMTPDQIKMLDQVEEMFSKAFSAGYKAGQMFSNEQWSNNACLGYVILGAERLKYKEEQTQKIVRSIRGQFDFTTVDEAETFYNKSPY